MAKLTVEVEDDLLLRFKVVATKERKSVSRVVRDFLSWYVEKMEREQSDERV